MKIPIIISRSGKYIPYFGRAPRKKALPSCVIIHLVWDIFTEPIAFFWGARTY